MTDKTKIVSSRELAEWIGVSERHVRRLAPILKQDQSGKFDLKASVKSFCDYLKSEAKLGGSPALLEQRTRLAKINADRKEYDLQVLKSKYLNADKVNIFMAGILGATKNQVMAVAPKLAGYLGGSNYSAPEVYEIAEKFLADSLSAVANLTIEECVRYAKQVLPPDQIGSVKIKVKRKKTKEDGGRGKK